jgi:hypothetical protein
MAAAAKVMDRLLDWQLVLQLQIREIEGRYPDLHEDLVDWGRWGRGIGTKPKLTRPGIWSLPGDYDPDLDPDAVPESPDAPINEKRVLELDAHRQSGVPGGLAAHALHQLHRRQKPRGLLRPSPRMATTQRGEAKPGDLPPVPW